MSEWFDLEPLFFGRCRIIHTDGQNVFHWWDYDSIQAAEEALAAFHIATRQQSEGMMPSDLHLEPLGWRRASAPYGVSGPNRYRTEHYTVDWDSDQQRFFFLCHACGMKSWHPVDAERRFCGNCKAFMEA